jgi:cell division protein FtsZ
VLINITGSHDLTLFELDEAANRIREEVDQDANIIVGSTLDGEMEGRMRVSVVATGIDATGANEDVPVPRRRAMSEPLALETPAEPVAAEPAPAAAREPEPEPEPEAASPDLFEGFSVAAPEEERAAGPEDGLPPPAYAPEPLREAPAAAAAPAPAARQESEGAGFVAPKSPRGTPSPEALARLQAAVGKARPNSPAPRSAAQAPAEPAADRTAQGQGHGQGRFGIGSLINRMSGHGEGHAAARPEARAEPRPDARAEPHLRASPRPAPSSVPPAGYEDEADANPEQERIEIPAFLRRQAN